MTESRDIIEAFPAAPKSARIVLKSEEVDRVGKVSITHSTVLGVDNLPDEREDSLYIVSQFIKATLKNRKDLLVPSGTVRNKNGKVIGCKSLAL